MLDTIAVTLGTGGVFIRIHPLILTGLAMTPNIVAIGFLQTQLPLIQFFGTKLGRFHAGQAQQCDRQHLYDPASGHPPTDAPMG